MPVQFAAQAEPIPGYKLLQPLGRGGFGEVWKAEAPGGVLKAIKLVHGSLRSGHGEDILVQQELKALSCVKGVRHPYILSMDRFDIIDGQLVIVMELADKSLSDRFSECVNQGMPGIPREELLRYMEETAEALDLMNIQYKLQHSDIKPQNLFLVHHHIKVADFGLVKDLHGMKAMTNGCFSPLYSAPETFEGWVSPHSDQYSLAIVFQESLTGVRPFEGKNARQLLMAHMQAPPNLTPLPASDRDIIGRALAKKPDERFPSCTDLVLALRRSGQSFLGPTSSAASAPTPTANTPSTLQGAAPPGSASGVYQLTFPTKCSGCGYMGRVPKTFKGRPVKCRECGAVFTANPVAGTPLPGSLPSPPPASAETTPTPQKAPPPAPKPPERATQPAPPTAKPPSPPAAKPTAPAPAKTAAPPAKPAAAAPKQTASAPPADKPAPPPKPAAAPVAADKGAALAAKRVVASKPTSPPPVPKPAAAPPKALPTKAAEKPVAAPPAPKLAWTAPPAPKAESAQPSPAKPPQPPRKPDAAAQPSAPERPKDTVRVTVSSGQSLVVPPSPAPAPPPLPQAETPLPAPPKAERVAAPEPPSSIPKAAVAPAASEALVAVPEVECPVCGNTKHAAAPNQNGAIKCLQCGCIHTTKPGDGPTPKPAAAAAPVALAGVQATVEPKPSEIPEPVTGNAIECPVCGCKGQLPELFPGGTLKCHQCGCVHRV